MILAGVVSESKSIFTADWIAPMDGPIFRDGAIVVVRPDHYVSHILPLSAREELTDFFGQFLLPQE